VFAADGQLSSFTGPRGDLARFWEAAGTMGLTRRAQAAPRLTVPAAGTVGEAFVVDTNVCFVAKGLGGAFARDAYTGAWPVAAKALNYGYLWEEVRVKGGAYGCSFHAGATGTAGFSTYRDPNLDATLARFDAAGAWLAGIDPDERAMNGYVVSTVAAHDAPQRPRQVARRQDVAYLTRRDPAWRDRVRAEELAATPADLRALSPVLERTAREGAVCVFGSRDVVERSEAGLAVVDLLA
jgi:hypothetical protein